MTERRTHDDSLSRRRLLALAATAAGVGTLSGCGYRPGGGDVRWEHGTGTGPYRPDDLLATENTAFAVNRSVRGFDFDAEEWGESAEIAAYDADSGGPTWEETTPPCGRPAAAGGRLYVGHEDDGLVAFGTDGEVRWEADVGEFPRTVAAGPDRAYALTETGALRAFAADDGERLWAAELGAGEPATVTAADDGVVVHHRAGEGTAADASAVTAFGGDGERRWKTELPGSRGTRDGRPVVADGTVYVFGGRELSGLSLRDGTERWSRRSSYPSGSLAVGDGTLYYVGDSTLRALDAGDGSTRWQFDPRRRSGRGLSSPPAVADGRVYVGGSDALYAISAADGEVEWQVDSESVTDAPRVAGETVVVSTRDGYVRGHHR